MYTPSTEAQRRREERIRNFIREDIYYTKVLDSAFRENTVLRRYGENLLSQFRLVFQITPKNGG